MLLDSTNKPVIPELLILDFENGSGKTNLIVNLESESPIKTNIYTSMRLLYEVPTCNEFYFSGSYEMTSYFK